MTFADLLIAKIDATIAIDQDYELNHLHRRAMRTWKTIMEKSYWMAYPHKLEEDNKHDFKCSEISKEGREEKVRLRGRSSADHAGTVRATDNTTIIIIIHLLGLAPAGYLTAPDNGPKGLMRGGTSQV
jgi:hypothetical protein